MPNRLKLREIAALANVSPAAVSLVYKGRPGVGSQKRKEISDLLIQNGYAVSPLSAPVQGSIRLIKYIKHSYLVDGNTGFVSAIIDSVEQACRLLGYDLLITTVTSSNLTETLQMLRQSPPDGVLLLGTEMDGTDFPAFQALACPLVVVDNPMENETVSSVTMDNRGAIYESVRYLRALGHRRIGFLSNEIPSSNCRCRERAFVQAMQDEGISGGSAPVFPVLPTLMGAYSTVRRYLEQGVLFPPAVIANNDCIALGAAKAFKENGLRIPEDVSLIGFDGIQFSEISEPPLTTIQVPCREIGTAALKLLRRHIEDANFIPRKVLLTAKLTERESTARLKTGGSR